MHEISKIQLPKQDFHCKYTSCHATVKFHKALTQNEEHWATNGLTVKKNHFSAGTSHLIVFPIPIGHP